MNPFERIRREAVERRAHARRKPAAPTDGRQAYAQGYALDANPHARTEPEFKAWQDAWRDAWQEG